MSEERRKMLKEMIEPTDPYERGFIDGMAKQRDSAVQRFVEGGTPDSELAEHKRIIREQQAEIEALKLRELTDEEIIKVYEDILGVASAKGSAIDFARAILKKASEK